MPRETAEENSTRKTGAPKVGQRLLGTHVEAKTAATDESRDLSIHRTGSDDETLDLIWGANNIAAYLNLPVSKTYYLIGRGEIPVKRLGHRTIAASRAQLRRLFENSTAALNANATRKAIRAAQTDCKASEPNDSLGQEDRRGAHHK